MKYANEHKTQIPWQDSILQPLSFAFTLEVVINYLKMNKKKYRIVAYKNVLGFNAEGSVIVTCETKYRSSTCHGSADHHCYFQCPLEIIQIQTDFILNRFWNIQDIRHLILNGNDRSAVLCTCWHYNCLNDTCFLFSLFCCLFFFAAKNMSFVV